MSDHRQFRHDHDYGVYDWNRRQPWNHRQPLFPRSGSASFPCQSGCKQRGTMQSFEDRVVTGSFSLASFPVHSQSLVQIPIHGDLMERDIRPSSRQIIQRSPSGLMNLPSILPVQEYSLRLNQLKKEIYNPSPKKLARGMSLYYRDEAKNVYKAMEKQNENDAVRCAVCLEDFEPKEEVMLTPCNHMFHEDCIVPWVKSHAQCPVCRFSLGD